MEKIDNNKFSFVDNKLFADVNGKKYDLNNISNIRNLKELNTLRSETLQENKMLSKLLKKATDDTEREYFNKKIADNQKKLSALDKQFNDELSSQASAETREADKIGDDMYVLKPFLAFLESFIRSDKGAFSKNQTNKQELEFTATPEETNKLLESIEEKKPLGIEGIKSLIPIERIKENTLELPSTEGNNIPNKLSDKSLLIMIDNNVFPAIDQKSLNKLLSNGNFVNDLSMSNNAKVFALDKETLMQEFSNLMLSDDKEIFIKENLKGELLKEFNKSTQNQQKRFIPSDKLDVSSITKLGIDVRSIPQSDIVALLSGDEIKGVKLHQGNTEAEANIRLEMNKDGIFECKETITKINNKFTLFDYEFSKDEIKQLQTSGRLTDGPITIHDGENTKEILPFCQDGVLKYRTQESIKLPSQYNGVEINKQQSDQLINGKTIIMKGLLDKDGNKYDGYVRFNVVKNILESIKINNESLSEKQTFKPKFKI